MEIKNDAKRQQILNTAGHLLIEGGPGSGKTTIALVKAKKIIESGALRRNQKILFLSFARATVTRVEQQAASLITAENKKAIEINTYHGFCWSVIQSYGNLLLPHKSFSLVTPPNLMVQLCEVPLKERDTFKHELAARGQICFDLFSSITAELLEKSDKIRSIFSTAYPVIILDEFQDTDENEWRLVKMLGQKSTIIALADLEQRIFEFRGASITRIPEFNEHFKGTCVDLGKENNRSGDKDIAQFGDDVLAGKNKGKKYKDVSITRYPFVAEPKEYLRYALIASVKRLKASVGKGKWSLAILVKTKAGTLAISSFLSQNNIPHDVIIDPAGPSLAASVIAKLLEPTNEQHSLVVDLIDCLISHIRGRKDRLTGVDGKIAQFLEQYKKTGKIGGVNQARLIREIITIGENRKAMQFVGVPETDWLSIRSLFQNCTSETLTNVYEDAKYLRLLNRGAVLSEHLSQSWREHRSYLNAGSAVDAALTQEHFSMTSRKYLGIYVMNIHKSKGKEFDETIIWEDLSNQIVYRPEAPSMQERILIRVAATRSRSHTTFLTPQANSCTLLV